MVEEPKLNPLRNVRTSRVFYALVEEWSGDSSIKTMDDLMTALKEVGLR